MELASASLGTIWHARILSLGRTPPAPIRPPPGTLPAVTIASAVMTRSARFRSTGRSKEPAPTLGELAKQMAPKMDELSRNTRRDIADQHIKTTAANYRAIALEIERGARMRDRVSRLLKVREQER